ncbi:MAG: hypothetical protein IJT34_00960, partial [Butyrivibrio sp.]|nr:hypothetical protein [Butyrivibrio sp.]
KEERKKILNDAIDAAEDAAEEMAADVVEEMMDDMFPEIGGEVQIIGLAQYGYELKLDLKLDADDQADLSPIFYSWRRDDRTEVGTKETYVVGKEDLGHSISITVQSGRCRGELWDTLDESHNGSGVIGPFQFQSGPNPFELDSVLVVADDGTPTYTVSIPGGDGYEYSFDGVTWSGENKQTGVAPGTEVTGYMRVKATPYIAQSPATSATITTEDIPKETKLQDNPGEASKAEQDSAKAQIKEEQKKEAQQARQDAATEARQATHAAKAAIDAQKQTKEELKQALEAEIRAIEAEKKAAEAAAEEPAPEVEVQTGAEETVLVDAANPAALMEPEQTMALIEDRAGEADQTPRKRGNKLLSFLIPAVVTLLVLFGGFALLILRNRNGEQV